MRASRQASLYRPHAAANVVRAVSTSSSSNTTVPLAATAASSRLTSSSSSTATTARRFCSTKSTTDPGNSSAEPPKYDAELWGRLLKQFLAENSLQQYEQEEFLVRRGWFEELFQGFDLINALPANERDEIIEHQMAIKKELESGSGNPSASSEAESVCCELTNAKELAMPKYQLRMPPHVLMFGSSVVGTAFKFGDVDFGSVFPVCHSLGMKINQMRDRELEKLYKEFDEVERLRNLDVEKDSTSDLAEAGSFVREHRGPQVLPLLGRATVAGMMYVEEAGYLLVHRQIQPQVLAAIYEYIMEKQATAHQETIAELLKKSEALGKSEPAVLQISTAPSDNSASSIDPLMQLGAFEEEASLALEIERGEKIDAATTTATNSVEEVETMTEEEKADKKLKKELLEQMHNKTPATSASTAGDSKIGQVLAGLTPEAIAARAVANGGEEDNIMENKKLGTVELGMDTHLIVHRIFRARVPIMQFSPPTVDGSHNKPQEQTLFDGIDAEQVQKEDQAAGKPVVKRSDEDLQDRLVRDDIKKSPSSNVDKKEVDSGDSKVTLTSETFSRFFAAGDAAKSPGKLSRFTKRLPSQPMQIGSTMGVTSLLDRGQSESVEPTVALDGSDIPKTAYFDPKTETIDEKRKRHRADAFHDARVSSSFSGSLSDIPSESEISSKKGRTIAAGVNDSDAVQGEDQAAATDGTKKKHGDGLTGSKNNSDDLYKNMTSVIYKKKEHYDLSLAISGVQNSLLLRHYMERDPELRAASLMLKYWGRKRRLLNARRGWISPYALTIMFVHYYVESQKLVAEKLKAEGKPLRKDRIYNYVQTTTVFPTLKEVAARFLRQDRGIISTREPIHHRYYRKTKEFNEGVGEIGKLTAVRGGVEVETLAAVEDLRGKDGKLYFPPSPQHYGTKMFDVSLYSYDDLLTNPTAVTETISYPLVDEPSWDEKERIWFEAVPRHLEGFFKYFSDETQFDFDRDIVDIRSELPEDRFEEKDTALNRIKELENCTNLEEFARLSAEFRAFKIAEASNNNDEIRCKSKHAPVFTSYTSFNPHSWRDFRYKTRDDWYNALKDEGVIHIVPGVSGVLNPYNGQKSHPTSSYFNSVGNGTMTAAETHEKAVEALRGQTHELFRMGLPRTNERWHRLGHEMLMIRDPYELHSLGRGTEFFRAEVIREEIRGAVDMKAGGLDDVEEFLKSL